jgi:hypothetical protein
MMLCCRNNRAEWKVGEMGRFMSPDPSGLYYADPTNPQSLNLYAYALNNPLSYIDPTGLDCVYLNNAGTDVDRDANGNVTGIDTNSNSGECGQNGGYWVDGTFTSGTVYTNNNDVSLTGHTTDSSGNQTSTDAFYTSATSPMGSYLLTSWGYTGLIGTVNLSQLYRNKPGVNFIGPQNPIDVAAGCIGSGAVGVASDLSGYALLHDLQQSAMTGSLNPAFNSGDRMNDAGNTVDVTEKAAKALKNTIPFLGPVAEKLGPVGGTITAVKAVRDLYSCVN